MHTICCSSCLPGVGGGGVCLGVSAWRGGVCLEGVVSAWRGWCLPGGGWCLPGGVCLEGGGVCPEGCLPGGGWCLPRGVSAQRGVCPEGCLPRGVSAQRGVCWGEGFCLGGTPSLWTKFLTYACENITFPQLRLRTVNIYKPAMIQKILQSKQNQPRFEILQINYIHYIVFNLKFHQYPTWGEVTKLLHHSQLYG